MSSLANDARQLMGLLRRLPLICAACATVKLALTAERVAAAVAQLRRSAAVTQTVSRCSVCGRPQAVLAQAG